MGLAWGAARLAHETGCPVIAAAVHRDGRGGPVVRFNKPFEPSDFEDADGLHRALAAHFEARVLERPEAWDTPLWRWRALEEGSAS